MAYTINHYNGTLLTTVADGTVDTSTDLTLIGKNYAGYGQAQNDNFVWLLENFANTTQPPAPLAGQIWYDSGSKKLKFFDGSKFRTTGGAEIGATQPAGLTQGDFWFGTANNQLWAYTGTQFTLIGPQGVAGAGLTEMKSIVVQDSSNGDHAIIQAIDDDTVIFIISADDFVLGSVNPITGFDHIHKGITLAYTKTADNGVTEVPSGFNFWGTASNSALLNGHPSSDFILSANPVFTQTVNFPDTGYTVGTPVKLNVFNDANTLIPTIYNSASDTIIFKTTVNNAAVTPVKIVGLNIVPGSNAVSNLGSSGSQWATVYATNFSGTATNANNLNLGGTYVSATTASTASTIAARDSNGDMYCNNLHGTATSAYYADLAEKYLPDATYEVGTVITVGGDKEVTACLAGNAPIGVISENPAFMMNKDLVGGVYVALKGRVPVKIYGPVKKGDRIAPQDTGYGMSVQPGTPDIFAVALESSSNVAVKLIECVIL